MAVGYVGEIRIWPMASNNGARIPVGWLECNGALLSIPSYEPLFALIGTAYGGNGTTNFALPDLRDRVPVHMGTGAGLTPRVLGSFGGSDTVTLDQSVLPAHSHTFPVATSAGTTDTLAANVLLSALPAGLDLYSPTVTAPTVQTVAPPLQAGGNLPHENLMSSMTLTYMICTFGIYPSRG